MCDALVALHSSDPVTVYLSAAARLHDPSVQLIDDALYVDHEVVRHHAMRRTLWVFTPEMARAAHASSTVALVGPMRRQLCKLLIANCVSDDPERWLDRAVAAIADTVADLGQATTRQIGEALPDLRARLAVPPDSPSGATIAAHTRVLNLMGFMGILVRARPIGTWASGQYRWALADRRLGAPAVQDDSATAAATIVDRYLRAFGPASVVDICWWTGWSKRVTVNAIEAAGGESVNGDDGELWVARGDAGHDPEPEPWVALLPCLDPTVMGWKQRQWYLPDEHTPALFDRNGNAGPTIWADGRVVGGWAQTRSGEIVHRMLEPLPPEHESLLNDEIERLRSFIGEARFTTRFPSPLSKELSR